MAGTLTLVALAAGCGGGSSTRTTPLETSTSVTTPTTTVGSSAGSSAAPKTTAAGSVPAVKPTPAQLSAVDQDLTQAGSSLSASDAAINSSDVNQAKAQEGSAP